ncbi:hypothetical protein BDZ89DRAFT_1158917 [Hymenopellis radicata]|nr:hypothetical protein BDZ89DRAFT_1158917 [Hymenopellis radicata]
MHAISSSARASMLGLIGIFVEIMDDPYAMPTPRNLGVGAIFALPRRITVLERVELGHVQSHMWTSQLATGPNSVKGAEDARAVGALSPYMNFTDVEEYAVHAPAGRALSGPSPTVTPSATFHADLLFGLSRPDLKILSSDNHLFHVHRDVLLRSSENNFAHLLADTEQETLIHIPEASTMLNVMFAAIYGIKLTDTYLLDTLIRAIDRFPHYGMQPKTYVGSATALYEAFATRRLFHHSKYEMADLVHPKYLLRLFHLHSKRKNALKDLLSEPLEAHSPTPSCNYSAYERLSRAWVLAVACLLWDADANTSVSTIQSTLLSLLEGLQCKLCRQILTARVKSIVVQWSDMKSTI